MKTITIKYKRETEKYLKHEDIYIDNVYIGYIIKDDPLVGNILEWHFCTDKIDLISYLQDKTRKDLLLQIKKHFGI
jgi:hypothetical protein